jgi:CubicO group peptidase (beta-lactamase class C family)
MLSNQLGPDVRNQVGITSPVLRDYGFGLSVAVRTASGIVGGAESVGDFSWPGANGTWWWGDPREELAVVWMVNVPGSSSIRRKSMQMIRALVNQAIALARRPLRASCGRAMSVHRSAVSTTDQRFGSKCGGWRLI